MISIIIPFYNSGRYLTQCLLSVQDQSCSDWEAILIDDGSTDDGPRIALEFSNADRRFRVIRQEKNLGQAAARNIGLTEAKGEYLTFLDSDDWWDIDFLEKMYQNIGSYDMIRCGYKRMSGNDILFKQKPLHKWQFSIVCACLFKSEAVKNTPFQEGYFYEDILWTVDFIMQHSKINVLNYYGYNYRMNPSSTTSKLHKADARHCIRCLFRKGLHPVAIYWTIKQSLGFLIRRFC